jgi:SWI/SNF-related matrix-associated actin-dependent regulator of chromatin subfamily A member 5
MTDANDDAIPSIPVDAPMADTPDYTDSDTNPNTTASSVAGDATADGHRRRSEATQLRKSLLSKKHDRLDESKVRNATAVLFFWV